MPFFFIFIRLRWWLIRHRDGSLVIFFEGKTSENLEKKSGVSEFFMAENLVLFVFLHMRVIPFSGKEMMAFPQSIIALLCVRKDIPR